MDESGVYCYEMGQRQDAVDRRLRPSPHGATMSLRFHAMRAGNQNLRAFNLAAVAAVLLLAAMPSPARSAPDIHPFSALTGSWLGTGTIKKSNGTSERIRCRSIYEPGSGTQLQLRLRCASDSYNFDLTANVFYEGGAGGAISGIWSEAARNVNGSIQGHSTGYGRQIQVIVQTLAFTSNLTLNTRGEKQSILIVSPGSEVAEVAIMLEKNVEKK
jgi:hypothetical protein